MTRGSRLHHVLSSRSRWVALLGVVSLIASRGFLRAQDLPVPAGVGSLEVVVSGATVRAAPSVRAARRGTVRPGTRLSFLARVSGEGCPGGEWYRIGEEAYLCETLVRPRREEPSGEMLPIIGPSELLPRRYAFVGVDGTWAYRRPSDYFMDEWSESLGQGFGLAITDRVVSGGVAFIRGLSGLWVPEDQLRHASGSEFEGVSIESGSLDVGWVMRGARRLGRRTLVRVRESLTRGRVRTDEGVISTRNVVRPSLSAPPGEVRGDERWIDIELSTQTLVAYEGERPVFATLISSGRPSHPTPTGTFRVWVKLAEDTMDDLERTDQESNYAIEGVPWVQYFSEGIGLHAAFWHDQFGTRRSHGCVNLSPRDARRLFEFTSPALPPGWDAILTTEAQPGTIVRVRD